MVKCKEREQKKQLIQLISRKKVDIHRLIKERKTKQLENECNLMIDFRYQDNETNVSNQRDRFLSSKSKMVNQMILLAII